MARFRGFLGPVDVVLPMSSAMTRLSPLGIGRLTNSRGGDQDVILSRCWGGYVGVRFVWGLSFIHQEDRAGGN